MTATGANRRGIVALIAGMATFSVNDVVVKFVAREYPFGEVIFVRGVMAVVLVGAMLVARGYLTHLRAAASGRVVLRSLLEALASALFIAALVRIRLADISAIVLISPLILTVMSVVFFHEHVGPRRWAAIAVGFLGTLLIVKPTPAAFNAWALLGVASAFASATRDLTTRRIDTGVPTLVISFSASITVMLSGLALGLFEQWPLMAAPELSLLALAAGFLGVGTYLMVLAFRGVDLSVVAPFRYTLLIWAALAGYLVFGEIPDRWAILGTALIVASGIYVARQRSDVR